MKSNFIFFALVLLNFTLMGQTTSGELKRWHKVTIDFNGPNTSETAATNPFSDYKLDVTFTHSSSGTTYVVPGFYSGCTDPEDSNCSSGDIWKVHFSPDQTGTWNWSVSFMTGSDVAINGGGSDAGYMNGDTGSIVISESDKTGRDFRNKDLGRLQYVGEHYLRYSGTTPSSPNGKWFVKAGADSPENTLAYEDFDNTPNRGSRRKSWTPHEQDYNASDASDYTWDGGKGTELLGVVNYLSEEGANAMSFLTFSLGGDDENVFPHLMKVSESVYNGYDDATQWSSGVHKDRFDVSKVAQWEKIFEYADKKGMYLHFKTMETENDEFMDGGSYLGRERKLYYRELVARFGHHLALNWNLSEESTLDSDVIIDNIEYLNEIDPYSHNIVLHTYPGQKDQRYNPLLGSQSNLTGASLQSNMTSVHGDVIEWIANSNSANRKWVVANDEQGPADIGIRVTDKEVREEILYGTLVAGGAGVEYYYGYTSNDGDLFNQDHRLRGVKYQEAGYAITFFENYFNEYLVGAVSNDGLTGDSDDYVLANSGNAYVVYLPNGGSTSITLPSGNSTYEVQWYNPRSGGSLTTATVLGNNLVAPDDNDWLALIKKSDGTNTAITLPGFFEAEAYTSQYGVQIETTEDTGGGFNLGYIENGDYVEYLVDVETSGTYDVEIRVASPNNGSSISLTSNGIEVGEAAVTNTGGWQNWTTIETTIDLSAGEQTLRLDFTGESSYLMNLNNLEFSESTDDIGDCIPLEVDGVLAVEAENYTSQTKTDIRQWYLQDGSGITTPTPDLDESHHSNASSGGYLEVLPDTRVTHDDQLIWGTNITNTGGEVAVLNYDVKFTNPGRYYVFVRAYSTGTEDNGIHVGLDGSWPATGNKMQWCSGKNAWTWESKQRDTGDTSCGIDETIYIDVPTAGVHTVSFSMREDGFEIDKFVFTQAFTKPTGTGPEVVLDDCDTTNAAPIVSVTSPANGSTFEPGASILLSANASDSDGAIAKVEFFIDGSLVATENLAPYEIATTLTSEGSYIITAQATDNEGAVTLSEAVTIEVEEEVIENTIDIPGAFEAEDFESNSGTVRIESTPGSTGSNLGFIRNGDYVEYLVDVDSSGDYSFDIYASSRGIGGTVEILEDGLSVGSLDLPVTGEWHEYDAYNTTVTLSAGVKTLRFLFVGGTGYLFNIDRIEVTASDEQPIIPETVSLSPIHDAYLQGSTRYDSSIVRVEQGNRTGYLMFDLSSISGVVTDASLKFTVYSDPGNGNLTVHKGGTDDWTEDNLSTSNSPEPVELLGSINETYAIGDTKTISLDVNGVSGDLLSLVLNATSGNDLAFGSKENAAVSIPELVVTYTSDVKNSNESADIKVFPVPVLNTINFSGVPQGTKIKIYNILGAIQKEVVLSNNQNSIDMSGMAAGYYVMMFLENNKANKPISTKKVIKL
ncbi:carbohydrate-binding protein [Aquimarina pacifica]|uniref:carbohydrate-binding protein n=1 Tax=Aquimarina pacifica TaxID=1296415 RepID=UPI001376B15D|nr:carbohydrate-binding protein [Aquimarina pacifica]